MKEKIKKWYKWHIWTADMVREAAESGVITQEDLKEVLDE